MRYHRAGLLILPFVLSLVPAAAGAQSPTAARPAVMEALARDIAMLQQKLISLAEAIPEDRYGWRPAEGVRSVSEVLVHIAADNYFLPTVAGVAAPAETAIRPGDYSSVQAYEARSMNRSEAVQAVRESFTHLADAMAATDAAFLESRLSIFGMEMSGLDLWVLTTTHLHEHLGQLIAYARSNGVRPPWSQ